MRRPKGNKTLYMAALLLAVITLASYWQVLDSQFITVYDDTSYVLKNTDIQQGLTMERIAWALTATKVYNWHPLTWMSHMLDYQLYGLDPRGHHATSLLLHIASTLLLFLVLNRMTRSIWRSAFVAALFALHPLHVESVAWVAERKDVLSTFFWMLTMLAYVWYTECPGAKRYALVAASFALGLMSKPMLVTLPFVLLLLDFWPLRRGDRSATADAPAARSTVSGKQSGGAKHQAPGTRHLILEKIPLFLMAAGSCAVTYYAQQHGGAVRGLDEFPLGVRLANGVVAYTSYIWKTIWPTKLSVMYPHPGASLPVWQVLSAVVLLVGITALSIRFGRRYGYLAVGWLWYAITLIPVIGLVQVGGQAMANRYTYVPLVGLFMAVAWGVPELVRKGEAEVAGTSSKGKSKSKSRSESESGSPVLAGVAVGTIAVMVICTWIQVGHWKNSVTLFEYAVKSTRNNTTALGNLGWAYIERHDWHKALGYFAKAAKIKPSLYDMHYGMGISYYAVGEYDKAIEAHSRALQIKPDFELGRRELDKAVRRKEELRGSKVSPQAFRQAAELYNQAVVADRQGNPEDALRKYREAVRIRPDFAEAYCNIGVLLKDRGNLAGAIREYQTALKYKPSLVEAANNLAVIYYIQGKYAESWRYVHAAVKYGFSPNPEFLDALNQKMPEPKGERP